MYMYVYMYFISHFRPGRSGSASKVVESSVTYLTSYIKMATDAIFSSVERCPILLRQALKMVWKRVSSKFQDDVSCVTDTPIFNTLYCISLLGSPLYSIDIIVLQTRPFSIPLIHVHVFYFLIRKSLIWLSQDSYF